ncbi:MAG: acyl-CoA thioesterase [Ignavibacteria bacterium]|nr:acyl-CoA thioesterase [Ignavibacteria bacterium]
MFNTKITVNFFDADPAGIIFYANLFRFAHTAYEELMLNIKTEKNYFFDNDYVLPIVHAEANYIKPIKVGDDLDVKVIVTNLKKSSFELSYSFVNNNVEVAAAKTVHVCVEKEKFEKSELPEELYNKLKPHLT